MHTWIIAMHTRPLLRVCSYLVVEEEGGEGGAWVGGEGPSLEP